MFKNLKFKQKYTWLVTGSCGFIGTNIVKYLLEHNQKVIGVDNFLTGSRKNLLIIKKIKYSSKNFIFLKGDLSKELFVKKLLNRKVDYVLHQAALGSVPRSVKDPFNTNRNNVNASLNLFYYSSKNKYVQKLVFASSGSVYGDNLDKLKNEKKIGNQLSPYAASKRIVEIYAETFNRCYGLKYVSLRYFNVFGPHQSNKGAYPTVISGWIKNILTNKKIIVFGNGSQTRDFCHVDRIIEANIFCAVNNKLVKDTFNISGGRSISLNNLIRIFKKIFPNKKIKVVYKKARLGDVKNSKASLHKTNKILNLSENNKFDKNLYETIEWYKKYI